MAKPRLHLDADVSDANLEKELLKRGHDVTRTPNEWAASNADDETQLLGAARHGRTILTFNARHFMLLAKKISETCWRSPVKTNWTVKDTQSS